MKTQYFRPVSNLCKGENTLGKATKVVAAAVNVRTVWCKKPELCLISFISFKRCSFRFRIYIWIKKYIWITSSSGKACSDQHLFRDHTHKSKFPVHSLETNLKTKRVFLLNSIAKSKIHSFRSTFQASESFLDEQYQNKEKIWLTSV